MLCYLFVLCCRSCRAFMYYIDIYSVLSWITLPLMLWYLLVLYCHSCCAIYLCYIVTHVVHSALHCHSCCIIYLWCIVTHAVLSTFVVLPLILCYLCCTTVLTLMLCYHALHLLPRMLWFHALDCHSCCTIYLFCIVTHAVLSTCFRSCCVIYCLVLYYFYSITTHAVISTCVVLSLMLCYLLVVSLMLWYLATDLCWVSGGGCQEISSKFPGNFPESWMRLGSSKWYCVVTK